MALNDVPQSNQSLADTQNPIRQNFKTYIEPNFAVDHVGFNTGANSGKHNKVTMPEQTVDATTLVNEIALYTKQGATSMLAELFLRPENNGTAYSLTRSEQNTNGSSRLPSGILIKWGADNVAAAAAQQKNFPIGGNIEAFTQPPWIVIIQVAAGGGNGVWVAGDAANSATVYVMQLDRYSGGVVAGPYRFLAIGI